MSSLIPLKAGDRVVCVDDGFNPLLMAGSEYTVADTAGPGGYTYVGLEGVADGNAQFWSKRFSLMAPKETSAPYIEEPACAYKVKTLAELDASVSATVLGNLIAAADQGLITEQDAVTLPNHYARFKIEPIRFICENQLNFFQGNILKYILRFDAKNGLEDLKKASRYLTMFIKFVEGDADWWKAPQVVAA